MVVTPISWSVGFAPGGLVVNQAMDATTSLPDDPIRVVRVPGPPAGSHQLILDSPGGGPYQVRVTLALEGRKLFATELRGEAAAGERLITDVTVEVQDGVPVGARAAELRPLSGAPPGNFVRP